VELYDQSCALAGLREVLLEDATYYAQLEQGARYLAALAKSELERREHLGWANRYFRLRLDAQPVVAHATA
jgi:hypothetical protein